MLGLVIYTKDFASTIDDFLYNLCVTAWHTQTLEPKKFDRSFSQIATKRIRWGGWYNR